jgi:hypothetical protein
MYESNKNNSLTKYKNLHAMWSKRTHFASPIATVPRRTVSHDSTTAYIGAVPCGELTYDRSIL